MIETLLYHDKIIQVELFYLFCITYHNHTSFTGKCPSYNSYQANMDEKDCSTDYDRTCPVDLYKSPLSVRCKHQHVFEILHSSSECHYNCIFITDVVLRSRL